MSDKIIVLLNQSEDEEKKKANLTPETVVFFGGEKRSLAVLILGVDAGAEWTCYGWK